MQRKQLKFTPGFGTQRKHTLVWDEPKVGEGSLMRKDSRKRSWGIHPGRIQILNC
jgi:hypothetical protein